jgi:RimJ/RimL family protein N-acetyltransferase
MNLIFEPREYLMRWAMNRIKGAIPLKVDGDWQVIGLAEDNTLHCVAIYHDLRENSIEMSIAADTPKWATRGNIRAFLHYPFCQQGVSHVRAVIHIKNHRSRRFVQGLGFKLEGVLRQASKDGKNLMLYGMVRKEADRWLNGQVERINKVA